MKTYHYIMGLLLGLVGVAISGVSAWFLQYISREKQEGYGVFLIFLSMFSFVAGMVLIVASVVGFIEHYKESPNV